jgi:hypothetical protein
MLVMVYFYIKGISGKYIMNIWPSIFARGRQVISLCPKCGDPVDGKWRCRFLEDHSGKSEG